MKKGTGIMNLAAAVLVGISALLVLISLSLPRIPGDTDVAAKRMQRSVERRLAVLNACVSHPDRRLPDDMVLYRYDEDTLTLWRNFFPVSNDDIVDRVVFQRLSNPRVDTQSPLTGLGDSYEFRNLGSRWYLVRRTDEGSSAIIEGLEIMNKMDDSFNGVNRRLKLRGKFTVKPLASSGGSPVCVDGVPKFKVMYESVGGGMLPANAAFVWLALLCFLAGILLFLHAGKTRRRFIISVAGILAALGSIHAWGHTAQNYHIIFSPTLFAGGEFFCSIGAVIIFNLFLLLFVYCMYVIRDEVAAGLRKRPGHVVSAVLAVMSSVGLLAYTVVMIRSITLNSNITLELYKLVDLSAFTLLVYTSFMMMLVSIPMILKMRFGRLSLPLRAGLASLISLILVLSAGLFGFHKEKAHTEVAADRIAVDRDIFLELQLRRVEGQIASDMVVSTLSALDNTAQIIGNRIADSYLSRLSQDYSVSVFVLHDNAQIPEAAALFSDRMSTGEPVAPNSRFLYSDTGYGPRYDGIFLYYNGDYGLSRVMVEVERKFGIAGVGRSALSSFYSFARYRGGDLKSFIGEYAYPTSIDESTHLDGKDGFRHFIYEVAEDETVVISRPKNIFLNFIIAFFFLALVEFLLISLTSIEDPSGRGMVRSYYRTRLTWVLMFSLTLTLVVMASVSVLFVYRLNNSNISTIMSDRAGSTQSIVQNAVKGIRSTDDLSTPEGRALVEMIASNTGSDISMYRPDGRLIMSSGSEPGYRENYGCRIDWEAYHNIVQLRKRFFYQKEKSGDRRIFSMYAPVFDDGGSMVAILRSPYNGSETYSFDRDAVMHSMTIFTVFLILLLLARFSFNAVLGRMLMPLSVMGRKMASANLDSLEQLDYDLDDEILPLVTAYNRMVTELSESTRRLAQAERDKAWSSMARQVAHEIKNPLTPMKLQLQRIIRLKRKEDPGWQDKFDEVSSLILDHIDILTETANEFSTFAKLYTEEPIEIDLDRTLQEEIAMFDNKENVKFNYMGLSGVKVMAPKPQLIRVFVNLITNAVQAVDSEDGAGGEVRISLRKASESGWYDIVFEDSGPGVTEENLSRLFTPNFTTKNGGTGLGLAISRSVLERCGATISYSRSFSLGGACFTIHYPEELSSEAV